MQSGSGRVTHGPQQGFTLLGLLFLVAAMGVGMAAIGTLWHVHAQREKEKQLLFVGDAYRRALVSYWNAAPQGQNKFPKRLDELLLDSRHPNVVRHIRQLYADPMTGKPDWELMRAEDGGITGLYSPSNETPYKTSGFSAPYENFNGAGSYRQWIFHTEIKNKESEILVK